MAKKGGSLSDPLGLVFFIVFELPILIIWLLLICVIGIAGLCGSLLRTMNGKKRTSKYTKPRTARSTATTKSKGLLSTSPKSNSIPKTKVTNSAANTSRSRVSTSTTKQISLYEALRLPGDPDPESGGRTIYVTSNENLHPSQQENDAEFDFEDEFIEEDFDEVEDGNEIDDAFAFAVYDFISDDLYMHENYDNDVDKDEYDDDEYDWETDCEYCEEFLEDCECDHRHESHELIGLWDCGCDEDDDWGSSKRDDDDHNGLCDFDKFSSFKRR